MLACAPGEQHDIGLLMLAVMLRADGWRVEFLGADTPVDAAVAFADRIGATMLCLSAARGESVDAAARVALASDRAADRRPRSSSAEQASPRDRATSSERLRRPASSTSPSHGCASFATPDEPLAAGRSRGRGGRGRLGRSSSRSTRRLFRFPYSDIALLGKLVTRGPALACGRAGRCTSSTAPSPASSSGPSTSGSAATRSGSRSASRWSSTSSPTR